MKLKHTQLDDQFTASASRTDREEIVEELDRAVEETSRWLASFYRSAVCKVAPDEALISENPHEDTRFSQWYSKRKELVLFKQDAFASLAKAHKILFSHVGILARLAWQENSVPEEEYGALLEKVDDFNDQANRLIKAFRVSLTDLDPLTGTQNRRRMKADLKQEYERMLRTGRPCFIALIDIDRFKSVNDKYGHLIGDQVLAQVTRILISNLRPYDSIYRFGGEEFLLCLPSKQSDDVQSIMERIRKNIDKIPLNIDGNKTLSITVSIGIAVMVPNETIDEITARADRALYAAKNNGRNQVQVWRSGLK